ncbi:hypothetical protein ACH5RR_021316 [Cinchona calisaya]|uniref:Uncharacterized protein n=1 Tax=Cinchona calisaya TaxID=153742 RepID=A0ABD2ZGZ7_9GENT
MDESFVKEKLDGALESGSWRTRFDAIVLYDIPNESSDHVILLLVTNPEPFSFKKRFTFDPRWLGNQGISNVVNESWKASFAGSRLDQVTEKIENCRPAFLDWNRKNGRIDDVETGIILADILDLAKHFSDCSFSFTRSESGQRGFEAGFYEDDALASVMHDRS